MYNMYFVITCIHRTKCYEFTFCPISYILVYINMENMHINIHNYIVKYILCIYMYK